MELDAKDFGVAAMLALQACAFRDAVEQLLNERGHAIKVVYTDPKLEALANTAPSVYYIYQDETGLYHHLQFPAAPRGWVYLGTVRTQSIGR